MSEINQNTEPLFIFDMPDDEVLSQTISVQGEKGERGDPTKTSQLINDSDYTTNAALNAGLATKANASAVQALSAQVSTNTTALETLALGHIVLNGSTGATPRYYKIATLPSRSSASQISSLAIHGKMGGSFSDNSASVDIVIANYNNGVRVYGDYHAKNDIATDSTDIIIYEDDNLTATVYLKTGASVGHEVNLNVSPAGIDVEYDGTYIDSPDGRVVWALSTDTSYVEKRIGGVIAGDISGDAATVNGHTVNADVPADAVFTDTVYDDAGIYDELDEKANIIDVANTYVSQTQLNVDLADINSRITALSSGSPLVASSVSEMTDTSRIYVNTTDGNWYYYDGSEWTVGGAYQSDGIGDGSVAGNHIFDAKTEEGGITWGYYIASNGTVTANDNWGYTQTFIPIRTGDTLYVSNVKNTIGQFYNSDMEAIGNIWTESTIHDFNRTLATENIAYIRFNLPAGYDHVAKINGRNVLNKFSIPWLKVKSDNLALSANSLDGSILANNSVTQGKLDLDAGLATTDGQIWSASPSSVGGVQTFSYFTTWRRLTAPIQVSAGDVIVGKNTRAAWVQAYDENNIKTGGAESSTTAGDHTFTVPANTSYVGVNIYKDLESGFELYINGTRVKVDLGDRREIGWLKLNAEQKQSVANAQYARFADYKTLFIGDSITEFNWRAQKNWVRYVTEWLGITNYTNGGMSGTGLRRPSGGNPNWLEKFPTYDEGYDMVLIMGDMNDWSHQDFNEANLGQYGDSTTDTFYGTLKVYLDMVLAKYPLAKIGWITSTPRNQLVDNTTTDYLHGKNSIFERANQAIKEVCNGYCIPVLELYHEANLYPWIAANNQEYFTADTAGSYQPDAIHPNSKGHQIMAYKIKDFITRNF